MTKKPGSKTISYETIKKYLPSKKIASFMGGTLIIIVLILVALSARGATYNSKNLRVTTVSEAIKEDQDSDGVPDWEERIFGTDPNNPDTDNDGIPDSTEIASQKDTIAAQNGYNPNNEYTLNETDKFARELFVTYNALSGQGTLSDSAANNIASAALSQSAQKLPQVATHSSVELKIVPQTPSSNTAYKRAVATGSQTGAGTIATEFTLVNQGVLQNNSDILRDAAKNAKAYNAYATALLKMSVPTNQVENHLRLINDVEYIATILPQIDTLENDVVRGAPLYTIYVKAYQDMFQTFEAIGKTN